MNKATPVSILIAWLCLISALVGASPAQARDTGGIRITVSQLGDGAPVAEARVFLVGWSSDASRAMMTDADGSVEMDSLAAGTYRLIVQHAAYQDAHLELWIAAGALTVVNVRLAKTPKVLARIVVAQRSEVSSTILRLNQQSAERRLSENLIGAINMLAGANVDLGSDGQATGISLRGHDPSATGYNIGGMHVGGSAALQGLDPDLLNSAALDLNREQVNLLLSGPTHDPTYTFDGLVGGFNSTRYKTMAQATSGSIGLVAGVIARGTNSTLNGAAYEDASGLTYQHVGAFHATASLLKFVLPVGSSWNASVDYQTRNAIVQPISDFFAGSLPQGIGPNNYRRMKSGAVDFSFNGAVGAWLVAVNAGEIFWNNTENDLNRIVALQPLPMYGISHGDAISTFAEGSRFFSLDHSLTLHLGRSSNAWKDVVLTPSFGALPATANANNVLTTVGAQDVRNYPARGISLTSDLGLTSVQNSSWRPSLAETLGWQRGLQSWKLNASLGAIPTYGVGPQRFQDPASATYDCADREIFANIPGDTNSAATSKSVSLEYARKLSRGSISGTLYNELDDNILLSNATVASSYEPKNLIAESYVASLISGYSTYGGCSGTPPAPDSIYFQQAIGGLKVLYRGMNLTSRFDVSHQLSISASYALTGAYLRSLDPRLDSPNSPFIFGRQLPNVPLQKLSLTEDWALRDGRSELLANELVLSSNNEQNLPSYVLVTIGLEHRFSAVGTFTLVASNATQSDVGLFVSPRFAIPLMTVSGRALSTLATPLTQPRLTVDLRLEVGRP